MKLKKLHIVNLKRLAAKGIYKLTYTPKSEIQLIVGPNGIGKSTLISQTSPFPGNPKDYGKNGLRHITFEDKGNTYDIVSKYNGSSKHTIKKNDIIIHKDCNITLYRKWVCSELNYSIEANGILHGESRFKFTTMSPQRRKEMFMKMYPSDMGYVFNLLKNINSSIRDKEGALKDVNKRIAKYSSNVMSEEDMSSMQATIEDTSKLISELSRVRNNQVSWGEMDDIRYAEINDTMSVMGDNICPRIDSGILDGHLNTDEISDEIERLNIQLTGLTVALDSNKREYDNIIAITDSDIVSDSDDGDLSDKLSELNALIDNESSNITRFNNITDANAALASLTDVWDSLIDISSNIPTNKNGELYNQARLNKTTARLTDIKNKLTLINNEITILDSKIHQLECGIDNQTCPKCSYEWNPTITDNIDTLKNDRADKIKLKTNYEEAIEEVTLEIDKIEYWRAYSLRYNKLVSLYPSLEPLWDEIKNTNTLTDRPLDIGLMLTSFKKDVATHKKIYDLKLSRDKISRVIDSDALSDGSRNQLSKHIEDLEKNSIRLVDSIEETKSKLAAQRKRHEFALKIQSTKRKLDNLLTEYDEYTIRKLETQLNKDIDSEVSVLQTRIATISKTLTDSAGITALVDGYINDKQRLITEIAAATRVRESVTQLISDSLMGFIQNFIGQLNEFIGNIWTSQLEISPCEIKGDDLDYLFKTRHETNGVEHSSSDVSETSAGETEIIDFAVRCISSMYLNMSDWPIYMDEVGHHFHETHRTTLYDYVKAMVENKRCEQVFVISHFPSTYRTLTNADVIVLDPTHNHDHNSCIQIS